MEALILSGALDGLGDRASLFASIAKMSAVQKENEKKQATSQIGLFDLGHHNTEHLRFSLEKAKAMTFEEKIRGEKQSIGYSVSGHGLDGLKRYVEKRTIGMEHVMEWYKQMSNRVHKEEPEMEEHGEPTNESDSEEKGNDHTPSSPSLPKREATSAIPSDNEESGTNNSSDKRTGLQKKPKKETMKRVRFIGLVTSVRHVQTKSGKMMAIATCDSFDFRFTVLVFSKEYEALSPLLEEDKVLLVDGIFRGNEENGEMSVTAQSIRASTITSIRQQAMDMNLFDPKAKVNLSGYMEELTETTTETIRGGSGETSENPDIPNDMS